MRTIFYIILLFSIHLQIKAQLNLYYSTPTGNGYAGSVSFQEIHIADDFGPRCDGGDSDWHSGIDFNGPGGVDADLGYLLLAKSSGGVRENTAVMGGSSIFRAGLKYLFAGDFSYVHLFDSRNPGNFSNGNYRVGDCVLMKQNHPNDRNWCIVFNYENTLRAIGTVGGQVTYNGQTIHVSTYLQEGDGVGPLGNSGTGAAHLHLGRTNGTQINDGHEHNPLSNLFLDYSQPSYTVRTQYRDLNNAILNGYTIQYGTRASPIRIIAEMNTNQNGCRYSDIMDIESVKFMVSKEQNGMYNTIMGKDFNSEIKYGGRIGENIYGHRYNRHGSWTVNGIQPKAYNCNQTGDCSPDRLDWFYISDIYWRISKNHILGRNLSLTNCPDEAKYEDGNYYVKAKVTTIRNNDY